MKTVLLVTAEEARRKLYEPELKKRFLVEFSPKAKGGSGKVDAVVYDSSSLHSTLDLRWLKNLDIPVVLLTPEERFWIPQGTMLRILFYPVAPKQILRALKELGVE